jgi:hypothetical protein
VPPALVLLELEAVARVLKPKPGSLIPSRPSFTWRKNAAKARLSRFISQYFQLKVYLFSKFAPKRLIGRLYCDLLLKLFSKARFSAV